MVASCKQTDLTEVSLKAAFVQQNNCSRRLSVEPLRTRLYAILKLTERQEGEWVGGWTQEINLWALTNGLEKGIRVKREKNESGGATIIQRPS